MEKELEILTTIDEDKNVTQRILAAKTGLSLGAINLLLKKMIEIGLIKIERLSKRTVKYILTPKGMMEKAKKTYDYVKRTYENIMIMKSEISIMVDGLPKNSTLWLYGEEDEVYHMLIMLLAEVIVDKGIVLKKALTVNEIINNCNGFTSREEASVSGLQIDTSVPIVVVWSEEGRDELSGVECINILDRNWHGNKDLS